MFGIHNGTELPPLLYVQNIKLMPATPGGGIFPINPTECGGVGTWVF